MWLVCQGIANLLLLPQLERDGFRVSYDTTSDWVITCPDGPDGTHNGGTRLTLKRDTGLCDRFPYLDMEDLCKNHKALAMIQTVRKNMEGYTKREIERAMLARDAQAMMGSPSEREYAKW